MKLKAFAKVNLCLEVLGRRGDGYHEVRTVMQTIDLADTIEISYSDSLEVTCDDPSISNEDNLAHKAVLEFASCCGRLPLVRVDIGKRIPIGMGLGGGSSDAAAVILALNRLWDVGYPLSRLSEIASTLGSDVPFFLWGGAALASGRGESIEPLPARPGLSLTLVCPGVTAENKTARMYSKLIPSHYSDGGVTQRLIRNMMGGQYSEELLYNAFEDVALQEFPGLRELFELMARTSCRRPHMTGAGPAWFLMPSSPEEHQRLSDSLQKLGATAYFAKTTGRAGASLSPVNPTTN